MKKAEILKAIEEGTQLYVDVWDCRGVPCVVVGEGVEEEFHWRRGHTKKKGWRAQPIGDTPTKERVVTSRQIVSTWADHIAKKKAYSERREKQHEAADARLAAAHVLSQRVVRVLGDAGVVVEPGRLMCFGTSFLVSKRVLSDDSVVLHVTQADLIKLLDHLEGK